MYNRLNANGSMEEIIMNRLGFMKDALWEHDEIYPDAGILTGHRYTDDSGALRGVDMEPFFDRLILIGKHVMREKGLTTAPLVLTDAVIREIEALKDSRRPSGESLSVHTVEGAKLADRRVRRLIDEGLLRYRSGEPVWETPFDRGMLTVAAEAKKLLFLTQDNCLVRELLRHAPEHTVCSVDKYGFLRKRSLKPHQAAA